MDNVISFDGRRGTPAMPEPQVTDALAEVRAYWDGLRDGRLVPLRADIDPRGIEGALPASFILERVAPGQARFRVAGQDLTRLVATDVRGMPIGVLFTPAARDAAGAALEAMFAGPEAVELDLQAETGFGRPRLGGRMVLLPLRSDLGCISRALGCLVTTGQTGRAPRRFDLSGVTRQALTGRGAGRSALSEALEMAGMTGLAQAPRPFTGTPGPRLTLVHDTGRDR